MKQYRKEKVPQDQDWDAKSLCLRYGLSPLEHMLKAMNDEALPLQLRCDMAKAVAPFVHHRLSMLASGDLVPPRQHSLDLRKLDDEELRIMERLVAKSQVTVRATDS